MAWFKELLAPINVDDVERIRNEKARFVPLFATPFQLPDAPQTGEHEPPFDTTSTVEGPETVSIGRRANQPPEWLEIAGDLSWTATFSSLTSGVQITNPKTLGSYSGFFLLMWNEWGTQTSYDLRYSSNDWFHRIVFAIRLLDYGILATCAAEYQVIAIGSIPSDEGLKSITLLAGIDIVVGFSKFVLLIQYARVLRHKRMLGILRNVDFLAPVSIGTSSILFIICAVEALYFPIPGSRLAMIHWTLWSIAVASQFIAHLLTPEDFSVPISNEVLKRRMQTLTIIIFGEGLNGICQTFHEAFNQASQVSGRTASKIIPQTASVAVIFYFLWLLYFDGFSTTRRNPSILRRIWMWLHAPYHLCLILMLEGIKNTLVCQIILYGCQALWIKISAAIKSYDAASGSYPAWISSELPDVSQPDLPDYCKLVPNPAYLVDNHTSQQAKFWRRTAAGFQQVILSYTNALDDASQREYACFLAQGDATLARDLNSTQRPLFQAWSDDTLNRIMYSSAFVFAAMGFAFVFAALLNIFQRRHDDRFVTFTTMIRLAAGFALSLCWPFIVPASQEINLVEEWSASYVATFLPIMALAIGLAFCVDLLSSWLTIRSIRKQKASIWEHPLPPVPLTPVSLTPCPSTDGATRIAIGSEAVAPLHPPTPPNV